MNGQELAIEHYLALRNVDTLMSRDLTTLWHNLETSNSLDALSALLEAVPAIGEVYGDMAASLATDFYESSREMADAPGRFVAKPADPPKAARLESLTRWAVEPLFGASPQPELVPGRIQGPLQELISNVARETVVTNSERDQYAVGWKRVTRSAGGCGFCRMLSDRSALYRPGSRFASHPNCKCVAAPSFDEGLGHKVSVEQYTASKANITDADRARLRRYLKKHYSG